MEGKFLFPSRVGDSRSLQCQRTNLGRLSEIILKDPSPPLARLLPLAIATHCPPSRSGLLPPPARGGGQCMAIVRIAVHGDRNRISGIIR